MEGLGIFGILIIVLGICITIAPLIIWRNTSRTNRLLALQLAKMNVDQIDVRSAWDGGGSHLASVPGYEDTGFLGAVKDAGVALKKTAENFKAASAEEKQKPVPVQPKNRFCPACGADAPLTAASCPSCTRHLADKPLYCPKCGHEISHRPSECPGCGVGLKWRESPA